VRAAIVILSPFERWRPAPGWSISCLSGTARDARII